MDHLEEVTVTDWFRSHWVARGPLGVHVEWNADIYQRHPADLTVVEIGRPVRRRQRRVGPVQARRRTRDSGACEASGPFLARRESSAPRWHGWSEKIPSIRSQKICGGSSNCSRPARYRRRVGIVRRRRVSACGAVSTRLKRREISARSDRVPGWTRECDWTHSGPAQSRGGRPRTGKSTSTAHDREQSARKMSRATTACCWKVARPGTADGRRGSACVEQFHIEHEPGIAGNEAVGRARRSVAEVRRDDEPPLTTHAHPLESLVPPANHFGGPEPEAERLAPG